MGGAGQTWRRRERTGTDFRSTAVGPEGRRAARRVAYLERPPKCLPRFQLNLRPRGQQKRRKSSFVRMGTLLRLPAPVCGQIGRLAGAKKSPPALPEHEVAAPTYRNDVPLRLVKQLHGDPDALRYRHGSSPGVTLAPFLGCGVAAVRSRLPARRLAKALEATFLNEFSGVSLLLPRQIDRPPWARAKGRKKETFEVAASEGQARRDGSRKLVGGSRRASGRDQGLREASQGTHLGDERRQPRTNEGLLDEEGEGGVASGAGGGEGTRGLAARTLVGAGREPGRLLRKQQKMARLPQRA